MNPMALYPPIELPVSPSTPMLSSLVRWDHSDSWRVPTAAQFIATSSSSFASSVQVDLSSPESEDAYMRGHAIDRRALFPGTGYFVLVWRQFAKMIGRAYQQTPVCFNDVHIHRATILPSSGKCVLCGLPHSPVALVAPMYHVEPYRSSTSIIKDWKVRSLILTCAPVAFESSGFETEQLI